MHRIDLQTKTDWSVSAKLGAIGVELVKKFIFNFSSLNKKLPEKNSTVVS